MRLSLADGGRRLNERPDLDSSKSKPSFKLNSKPDSSFYSFSFLLSLASSLPSISTTKKFLAVVFAIQAIAVYFFIHGFFLTRYELRDNSLCELSPFPSSKFHLDYLFNPFQKALTCDQLSALSIPNKEASDDNHDELDIRGESPNQTCNGLSMESTGCWSVPKYDKLIVMVVDALRYDFIAPFDYPLENPTLSKSPLDNLNTTHTNDELHSNSSFGFPTDPPYRNKMKSIRNILKSRPQHSRLYRSIADAPTATMQRIKGMTTGGLPTFIDIKDNFSSASVGEDSWVRQARVQGKKVVHMGDDTWALLFPDQLSLSYPFPSFNVNDLHTVDDGCIANLRPTICRPEEWDLIIAHFLGVDHIGHSFYDSHPQMALKLAQLDNEIGKVIEFVDAVSVGSDKVESWANHACRSDKDEQTDTSTPREHPESVLLVVLGDHGMTSDGNHGGSTDMETGTGLFIYSSIPFLDDPRGFHGITTRSNGSNPQSSASTTKLSEELTKSIVAKKSLKEPSDRATTFDSANTVMQIDIVPTLSYLLGLPMPFGSLGKLIAPLTMHKWEFPKLFSLSSTSPVLKSAYGNDHDHKEDVVDDPSVILQHSQIEQDTLSSLILEHQNLCHVLFGFTPASQNHFSSEARLAANQLSELWTSLHGLMMNLAQIITYGETYAGLVPTFKQDFLRHASSQSLSFHTQQAAIAERLQALREIYCVGNLGTEMNPSDDFTHAIRSLGLEISVLASDISTTIDILTTTFRQRWSQVNMTAMLLGILLAVSSVGLMILFLLPNLSRLAVFVWKGVDKGQVQPTSILTPNEVDREGGGGATHVRSLQIEENAKKRKKHDEGENEDENDEGEDNDTRFSWRATVSKQDIGNYKFGNRVNSDRDVNDDEDEDNVEDEEMSLIPSSGLANDISHHARLTLDDSGSSPERISRRLLCLIGFALSFALLAWIVYTVLLSSSISLLSTYPIAVDPNDQALVDRAIESAHASSGDVNIAVREALESGLSEHQRIPNTTVNDFSDEIREAEEPLAGNGDGDMKSGGTRAGTEAETDERSNLAVVLSSLSPAVVSSETLSTFVLSALGVVLVLYAFSVILQQCDRRWRGIPRKLQLKKMETTKTVKGVGSHFSTSFFFLSGKSFKNFLRILWTIATLTWTVVCQWVLLLTPVILFIASRIHSQFSFKYTIIEMDESRFLATSAAFYIILLLIRVIGLYLRAKAYIIPSVGVKDLDVDDSVDTVTNANVDTNTKSNAKNNTNANDNGNNSDDESDDEAEQVPLVASKPFFHATITSRRIPLHTIILFFISAIIVCLSPTLISLERTQIESQLSAAQKLAQERSASRKEGDDAFLSDADDNLPPEFDVFLDAVDPNSTTGTVVARFGPEKTMDDTDTHLVAWYYSGQATAILPQVFSLLAPETNKNTSKLRTLLELGSLHDSQAFADLVKVVVKPSLQHRNVSSQEQDKKKVEFGPDILSPLQRQAVGEKFFKIFSDSIESERNDVDSSQQHEFFSVLLMMLWLIIGVSTISFMASKYFPKHSMKPQTNGFARVIEWCVVGLRFLTSPVVLFFLSFLLAVFWSPSSFLRVLLDPGLPRKFVRSSSQYISQRLMIDINQCVKMVTDTSSPAIFPSSSLTSLLSSSSSSSPSPVAEPLPSELFKICMSVMPSLHPSRFISLRSSFTSLPSISFSAADSSLTFLGEILSFYFPSFSPVAILSAIRVYIPRVLYAHSCSIFLILVLSSILRWYIQDKEKGKGKGKGKVLMSSSSSENPVLSPVRSYIYLLPVMSMMSFFVLSGFLGFRSFATVSLLCCAMYTMMRTCKVIMAEVRHTIAKNTNDKVVKACYIDPLLVSRLLTTIYFVTGTFFWLLSVELFTATGHSSAFSHLHIASAFIGFPEYIHWRSGLLLIVNTFGPAIFPLLCYAWIIVAWSDIAMEDRNSSKDFINTTSTKLFVLPHANGYYIASLNIISVCFFLLLNNIRFIGGMATVLHHRDDLLMWPIFAPKFIMDASTGIITSLVTIGLAFSISHSIYSSD